MFRKEHCPVVILWEGGVSKTIMKEVMSELGLELGIGVPGASTGGKWAQSTFFKHSGGLRKSRV